MKKYLAVLLLAVSLATPAFAWSGGPWSNGSALDNNQNTVGYYQATVSGKNMIGLVEFTYAAQPTTSNVISSGSALVFYQGWIYKSTCGAFVNEPGRKITGIIVANSTADTGVDPEHIDMHGYFQAKMTNTGASSTFSGNGKKCKMIFQTGVQTDPEDSSATINVYSPEIPFKIRGSRTARIANNSVSSQQ